jgi:hypothetical protein
MNLADSGPGVHSTPDNPGIGNPGDGNDPSNPGDGNNPGGGNDPGGGSVTREIQGMDVTTAMGGFLEQMVEAEKAVRMARIMGMVQALEKTVEAV